MVTRIHVLLLVILVLEEGHRLESTAVQNCPDSFYECSDGTCIYDSWVCDGFIDCLHGEDEADCEKTLPHTKLTTVVTETDVTGIWKLTTSAVTDDVNDTMGDSTTGTPDILTTSGATDDVNDTMGDSTTDTPDILGLTTSGVTGDMNDTMGNFTTSTTSNLVTTPPVMCSGVFDLVGGRCVLVDPFIEANWKESRYFCERFDSDLVVLDSFDFYSDLLQYISEKGLTDHDYWVGAFNQELQGHWVWIDGSPVHMGTPLWALYSIGDGTYGQEPMRDEGEMGNCAFLDRARFYFLNDLDCETLKPSVCQKSPGSSLVNEPSDIPASSLDAV